MFKKMNKRKKNNLKKKKKGKEKKKISRKVNSIEKMEFIGWCTQDELRPFMINGNAGSYAQSFLAPQETCRGWEDGKMGNCRKNRHLPSLI